MPYYYNKKIHKKDSLPKQFSAIPNDHYENDERSEILSVIRNASIPNINDSSSDDFQLMMPTWAGSHALLSSPHVPLKRVGFAPIIPNPITKHETVFTILRNLNCLVETLDQTALPFVCDEDVYHIVIDIYVITQRFSNVLFQCWEHFIWLKTPCDVRVNT